MSDPQVTAEGAQQRLPVLASVVQAYRGVFGRPLVFTKIAALPIVSTAMIVLAYLSIPWQEHPLRLLFFSLLVIPLSYLAFAWLRFTLLEEKARFVVAAPWTGAYGRMLGLGVLWTLWLLGAPFAMVAVGMRLLLHLSERPWEYAPYLSDGTIPGALWLALVIVCLFLLGRQALAAPAAVIGQPATPRAAWRYAAVLGWRLNSSLALFAVALLAIGSACVFVVAFILLLVLAIPGLVYETPTQDTISNIVAGISFLLISLIGSAVFAELLAIAFRKATGWHGPQRHILERFE